MPTSPTHTDVIKIAERNNVLLKALIAHPKFNRDNPGASPRPLFFTSDFVRRTYLDCIIPLLPKDAQYKSPKIANRDIFRYQEVDPSTAPFPEPIEGEDPWLNDLANWPSESQRNKKAYKDKYTDAVSRTQLIGMILSDREKGAMFTGGPFDWDANPDIARAVAEIVN